MRKILLVLLVFTLSCSSSEDKFKKKLDIDIEVEPNFYTFPATPVGEKVTKKFQIKHIGTEGTLKIEKIELENESSEFLLGEAGKNEIKPGESTTFELTFKPQDELPDENYVLIYHNSSFKDSPLKIKISTVAPSENLVAFPQILDFGEVLSGESKVLSLTVKNQGSKVTTIKKVYIREDSSPDFSIEKGVKTPVSLKPSESVDMELKYTPKDGNSDIGYLVFETDGEEKEFIVNMEGTEVGPEILVIPGVVDFGWTNLGETKTLPVTVQNKGARDLVLKKVEITDDMTGFVSISDAPESGFTLPPGEKVSFEVVFSPESFFNPSPDYIARVYIESNDVNKSKLYIPVFGRVSSPNLVVSPQIVDFGFVAKGDTVERVITLLNNGYGDLTVTSIEIEPGASSEFAIKTDNSFGPIADTKSEGLIQAGEYVGVTLTFSNLEETADSEVKANLIVKSNDPDEPEIKVPLIARRTAGKECKVKFEPPVLNFGFVPYGYYKIMDFKLKNIGSGNCTFKKAKLGDCMSFGGFINTCQPTGISSYFKLLSLPPSIPDGLKPQEYITFKIKYTPPENGFVFTEFNSYSAVLSVELEDSFNGTTVLEPEPDANGLVMPNIKGSTGQSFITVLPPELDFGLVSIGCTSEIMKVTIYNTGEKTVKVKNLKLEGCSIEFKIKEYPPLPFTLNPQGKMEVGLVYAPQDDSKDKCILSIELDDENLGSFSVPLYGEGTYDTEQTDVFIQKSGQEVDILFVVDNSGSMGDDQENLANNFDYLTQEAEKWKNDYHIGVITTDMSEENPMRGKLVGNPRFVTPQNWQKFKQNVKVGDNGSATEQGLAAAQAALSFPLAHDTNQQCEYDSVCTQPDKCVDGFCGGYNRGFLRDDATLHIIIVSDEQDDSAGEIDFYIDFFKNLKGFANSDMVKFHSIVGLESDVPDENNPNQNQGCAAEAGTRYIEVSNATGGIVTSICDPDWAQKLKDIGNAAFGLKVQFFLTRPADPPTIQVYVDGNECTDGWTFDQPSNSIIFDKNGPCMPQVNQEIKVHYEVVCYQNW